MGKQPKDFGIRPNFATKDFGIRAYIHKKDFGIRFVSSSFNGKKGIMKALPIAMSSLPSINRNTYSETKKKRGNSDDSQRIAPHINA